MAYNSDVCERGASRRLASFKKFARLLLLVEQQKYALDNQNEHEVTSVSRVPSRRRT